MPRRVQSGGSVPSIVTNLEGGARRPRVQGRRFGEVLRPPPPSAGAAGPSPAETMVRDAARSIARGERVVDRAIRAGRRGEDFSEQQLLALQAGVYRYTQELELASKLVDKSTGAVRQTLQSQH